MKNINRLLAAAAILLSAAACHTNEIDPVKPDPLNPGKSGLTITANIVKTRVTYNDRDEDYLDQQWEEGDILFGYYGRNVDNKVILTVSGFDEAENAILIPAEDVGAATLKDLAKLEDDVPVDLVYIGANVSAAHYPFDTDGNLTIDMSPKDGVQDGVNIPACMHARAYVEIPDKHYPQNKSLFFKFENDCAIIEIYSLTGVKEEVNFDTELDSLSVSNLLLKGTYSLGDNGFTFAQTTGTSVADFSADLSETDWYVDSDGRIFYDDNSGNTENRYLIAVVPNDTQEQILVNTYINGDDEPHTFDYGEHDFDAGKCYVIRDADVVAKTVDGLYFTTVKAAFDHAHEIRLDHPDDNTVTLVKDEIYGLVDHDDSESVERPIEITIDYPVTLDLNGCSLYLGSINEDFEYDKIIVSESFYVDDGGEFTITDRSDIEFAGCIWSDGNSAASIIKNEGTVIIENGFILQYGTGECDVEAEIEKPVIIENRGSLSVNGGDLSNEVGIAIDSYEGSDTTIGTESGEGPDIGSEDISIFIHSDDTAETIFEMKGGSVSGGEVAVKLDGKNANGEVSGGNITASAPGSTALLVQNYSTCIIYGGYITNIKNAEDDASSYAVHLAENAECIIDGGLIDGNSYSYAVYSENSKCTISGGTVKSDTNTPLYNNTDIVGRPTIYCSTTALSQETDPSFVMRGGSVGGTGFKLHLDNNVKGSITGGTITTTACRAIHLSGAVLDIDGTDNTINISNGNIQDGGQSWSTILIGNGSNCTISGEKTTISNSTNGYGYAVEINNGNCTLSGGTIKTASFIHSAVYCYRSKDGTTTDLTIQWAEGSSESDRLREGPLIVCTYVPDDPNDPTYIPSYLGAVSTKDLLYQESEEAEPETRTNYAKVEISGGYLYANDGAFYSQSQEGSLSITGSFYTNLGSLESPIKSPYFDFTQECLKYVSSEIVDVDYGDYKFDHKITSVSEEPSTDPDPIKSRFL